MKHSYSSVSSLKRSCHGGGHSSRISSHISPAHHGGSHGSYHGGSQMSCHGGFSMPHHGGSNFSHHGGFNKGHVGGSHFSHHGGSHYPLHGSFHKANHGSSFISPHSGSCKTQHGGSHMSHHGGSFKSHHGGSHMSHHGGSNTIHHGSHHKASNVHAGTVCKYVSFSKHASSCHIGKAHGGAHHGSHSSSHGMHGGWKNDGLLSINEKETMQILNDRLSSYLDKVRSLEQENAQLERKIGEWYENNAPSSLPDSSQFIKIIADLQNQISAATTENARTMLQIDNARLAADDFRNKYEMELRLREGAEGDVNNLRRILEALNREGCDLGAQVQNLQEELQEMKRNHEEEVTCLRAQLGARVNVEVNAAPSVDLNAALAEIRQQYENLMERNLRDVESMFQQRSEELNRQVTSGSEQLQSVQTELIDLKRCVQTLEIELQSQLSMTAALQCSLAETQATYSGKLAQIQEMINNVEGQLARVRSDLERQNQEYKILMDQKTHLEMEIATYKRLLDGHDINVSGHHMSSGKQGSHTGTVHHAPEPAHDAHC